MRILVAGLGAVGQRHARNLRTLLGDALELHAWRRRGSRSVITDTLTLDSGRDVHDELGIVAHDTIDAAFAAKPDAVVVCTPSAFHLEVAQRAVDEGRHLFVEKPVSHTWAGVARLASSARSRGRVAMVGSQWRFHPCVIEARRLLASGELGAIAGAEVEYQEYLPDWHPYEDYRMSYAARADLGGGVILTQIHDYDLAYHLFGAPDRATATGGHLSDLEIDVEDTVDATLRVGERCRVGRPLDVRVRQSFAKRPPERLITVRGERATATVDLRAARIDYSATDWPPFDCAGYQRNQMFRDEMAHFLDCISGRAAENRSSLEEGCDVLKVALGVKQAMREGVEWINRDETS